MHSPFASYDNVTDFTAPQCNECSDGPDEEPEQTEFTFNELDERAKQNARDEWLYDGLDDNWWDYIYEDVNRIAPLVGIEIDDKVWHNRHGRECRESHIYFSGFCSQNDGCCFTGTLYIKLLNGAEERVRSEAPKDDTLAAIARQGQALYDAILLRAFTMRLSGITAETEGHDFEEIGVNAQVMIQGEERHGYSTHVEWTDAPCDFKELMDDYVEAFANWIYHQLEAEYDYQTSDECVDENIRCNHEGAVFDENGRLI